MSDLAKLGFSLLPLSWKKSILFEAGNPLIRTVFDHIAF
jgi:hypothetical protein